METVKKKSTEKALFVLDKSQPVEYSSDKTPTSYFCTNCGVQNVKLWRMPGRFSNSPLKCVKCVCEEQKMNINDVDGKGTLGQLGTRKRTSQIGVWIPAIPKPENDSFWGHLDSPVEAQILWQDLPNA